MIVTVEWLKSLEACADQVKLFSSTFGESVEVTKESLTRAHGAGLDLDWFGRTAFGEAYNEAIAPAFRVYEKVVTDAWKVDGETSAPAWEAYGETIDLAWKACKEMTGRAWEVYFEVKVEVIFNLSQVTTTL